MRRQEQKRALGPWLILVGIALLALMFSFSKPETVRAEPADLSSAVAKYPSIDKTNLDSCDLCHTSSPPDLNPYGAAYLSAGRNTAAFGLIENLDSDNDGFTNIQEINSLTFPGDPTSFPIVATATATATATFTTVPSTPPITATPTNTSTITPTNTSTFTPTNTPTFTPLTPTNPPTFTPTNTQTSTPTDTPSFTPTNTPTFTPTNTSVFTPTNTPTSTPTDTPSFTPTNTPTFTPTNTPAFTLTNTPTSTPTNTQTNTPTETPTFTPTNTQTNTPTNTPTGTPTNTPTSTPVPNTPGKVTGGGNANFPDGKVTFGFVVKYSNGVLTPVGNLTFKDHGSNVSLKATSFTLLNISGNHAVITGYAIVNGESNFAFTVTVVDGGAPGLSDIFMIEIPALNGYSTGGILWGGKIQISTP